MTLKQAFTLWANAPRNLVLAAKSRDAVQRVLMKKWNDIDLEQITPTFAAKIFSQSSEPQEYKVKAASILVYLLQWGDDHGYCQRPTFDYTIASMDSLDGNGQKEERHPMPPALAEISGTTYYNEENDKPKEEKKIMNSKTTKPRGKKPRPCVQIDMATLKPIKTWPSIIEVQRVLGIKNVERAIERKGTAGGYHWCNVGEEADFKPSDKSLKQVEAERKKKEKDTVSNDGTPQPQPIGITPDLKTVVAKDITIFSNEELIAEMKRRGWKGTLTMTVNVEL